MARDMTHGGRRTGRPPGKRKQYARERGQVPSSIPPDQRRKLCKACRVEKLAGELRLGYCADCWSQG
ncbi:hypothetical protein [Nonomuraea sp. NPDC005692]|uniref:hypothetical protein n=1 Tax=Nonomuraea sp. NPDC005692 TaxID=3157168 RepID=UPI0033EF8BF9